MVMLRDTNKDLYDKSIDKIIQERKKPLSLNVIKKLKKRWRPLKTGARRG